MAVLIFITLILLLIIPICIIYNQMSCQRNMLREYFSKMDIHFQYRQNFLPLFLSTVQSYIKTEDELIEKINNQINDCRNAYYLKEKVEAENILTNSLNVLILIIQNYPKLKSDETFINLKRTMLQIEEKIQTAKKQYNSTVRMYNDLINVIPHKFFAKILGFKDASFFEIEALIDPDENSKK